MKTTRNVTLNNIINTNTNIRYRYKIFNICIRLVLSESQLDILKLANTVLTQF